jgi:hypothetical protein
MSFKLNPRYGGLASGKVASALFASTRWPRGDESYAAIAGTEILIYFPCCRLNLEFADQRVAFHIRFDAASSLSDETYSRPAAVSASLVKPAAIELAL